MKRFSPVIAVFLGMLVLFAVNLQPLPGQARENQDRVFEIKTDGTVKVEDMAFENLSGYLKSDYFKKSGKRCGTDTKRWQLKSLPLAGTGDCTISRTVIQNQYWPSGTYTIPVVFHIIHKSDGTGNIPDQRIYDQVEVLNEDFRAISGSLGANGFDTKIQFQLAGITRTANNNWFNDQNEFTFKNTLGWSQDKYLNVYTNSAGGYLGYAYLPQELPNKVYDGVVLLYEAIGGRGDGPAPYNQGRTLVHEVGHYLGLLHTFEEYGCYQGYQAGDLIADTNSENDEHYGCFQTHSCGTPDPIDNYMNYTDDSCMEKFTREQANRLVCSLVNYRPSLYDVQSTQPSITVTSPNGGESWTVGSSHNITWTSTGAVGSVKIQFSANNGSSWSTITSSTSNDGSYSWTVSNTTSSQCKVRISEAADGSPSDTSNAVFSITSGSGGSAAISLNRSQLFFTAAGSGSQTGSQEIWISNSGSGTLNWSVSDNASWLSSSPGSGTNAGVVTVWVNPGGLTTGHYTGTISVSSSNASNSPRTVSVRLTVKGASQDQPPFGEFSTPVNGSTVRSSIPVTGWVLDDVEVKRVRIYNGSGYIGDAVFVSGARPDVEQAYPGYPKNDRAGWGYMLLTYQLPNGGNGKYTLYAQAVDSSGKQVTLGAKTITLDNSNTVKPFGALDTPAQGGIASGKNYANWGWALTPQPNRIPINGSTINVYVDGVNLGHPDYNIYRSDIAALFPGYANSSGAVGIFYLDTTAYRNGIHTIQWTARDNAGNTDGIGSRYFTILNTASNQRGKEQALRFREPVFPILADLDNGYDGPVTVKKGYDEDREVREAYPGDNGLITIETRELERIEINLGQSDWLGFQVLGERFGPLPIGSHLDKDNGFFYWIPGPAFLGDYLLVFIDKEMNRVRRINIKILPKF